MRSFSTFLPIAWYRFVLKYLFFCLTGFMLGSTFSYVRLPLGRFRACPRATKWKCLLMFYEVLSVPFRLCLVTSSLSLALCQRRPPIRKVNLVLRVALHFGCVAPLKGPVRFASPDLFNVSSRPPHRTHEYLPPDLSVTESIFRKPSDRTWRSTKSVESVFVRLWHLSSWWWVVRVRRWAIIDSYVCVQESNNYASSHKQCQAIHA